MAFSFAICFSVNRLPHSNSDFDSCFGVWHKAPSWFLAIGTGVTCNHECEEKDRIVVQLLIRLQPLTLNAATPGQRCPARPIAISRR